jgi:hypothetical protein
MIEDSVLLLPRSLLLSFSFKTANITLPIPFYLDLEVLLATPPFGLTPYRSLYQAVGCANSGNHQLALVNDLEIS